MDLHYKENSNKESICRKIADFVYDSTIYLRENITVSEDKLKKLDKTKLKIYDDGETLDYIMEFYKNYIVPNSNNASSPFYMGFPDSGNSVAGIVGSIGADLLQQNLINYPICSPIATLIEAEVINFFRQLIGWERNEFDSVDNIGGIVTTGGTISNAIALLLSRIYKNPNSYREGIKQKDNYVIVPKNIAHYSIEASGLWLGHGYNVIEVETNNYRYNIEELERILKHYTGKVSTVVIYAGDSRTMTIDCIRSVIKCIRSHDKNIWVHIDACNGFCLAFNEKLKLKLDGIEECDSVAFDPHKMMMLPYTGSVLLVKNVKNFGLLKTSSDLIMKEIKSFGQITPLIGSKAWMSLKMWTVLKYYGVKGLSDIMQNRYSRAQYFKESVLQNDELVLINDVDAFAVAFMYVPDKNRSIETINKLNVLIYKEMIKESKIYLHQFPLVDDKGVLDAKKIIYPLRFFSGNDLLTNEMIDFTIDYICDLGRKINEKSIY